MKIFFTLFGLIAIVLAVYPFLNETENKEVVSGLPWQIVLHADGSTEVFGLQVGKSRLSDARYILGDDMELAIIAATDEPGNLEMYYGHYRAGLLKGKLVLQTDAGVSDILRWRENALTSKYMASGRAKKYSLSPDDLSQILDEVIIGMTFIPAVNLDEGVILARFGEPEQRIEVAGAVHYLYPEKGLDIALHEESKEVLQYVPPASFQQLIQPLLVQ